MIPQSEKNYSIVHGHELYSLIIVIIDLIFHDSSEKRKCSFTEDKVKTFLIGHIQL